VTTDTALSTVAATTDSRVAVVTSGVTSALDATSALEATVRENWPEAEVHVLTSSRLDPSLLGTKATPVLEINETPYLISRILSEGDQVALGLPRFLSMLLDDYDTCVYLGPELLIVRRPDALLEAARELGSAVVVPGTVTPVYSLTPSLGPIEAGPFLPDARVVAATHASKGFLDDWAKTLEEAVLDVDQRPVTWASETFLQRSIARSDVAVEGESTFLHWADFASVEVGRAVGPEAAIIACDALFVSARELSTTDDPEVAWSMLVHRVHDSRPVEPFLRLIEASQSVRTAHDEETGFDLLRAEVWRAVDPFGRRWNSEAMNEFDAWLFETNDAGCTRIADLLVKMDPGLSREHFNARFDPTSLKKWVEERGRTWLGFDPFDRSFPPGPSQEIDDESNSHLANALRWRWNTIKSLVPGYTERATKRLERAYLGPDPGATRGIAPPRHVPVTRQPLLWGSAPRDLNLLGPFRSESGLGQAARASLNAVRLLGRSFTHVDTTEKYPSRNAVDVGLTNDSYGQLGDVNLIHTNADEMITLAPGAFKHRFGGRFNAAMWFWETADLPLRSRPAFHIVDELWVASEYQRDVFGQYAQVPVHVIGLAADLPRQREVDRSAFGWRDDELVFLFVYDALSSYGRKNPSKALDAFISAFAPDFEDVRFVLKVSNLNKFPASQREILGLQERYEAISVIDEYLTREDVMNLMAAADIYVSLHAAEGYGLTLLESMAMGTPVICTAYSGNMDFTNNVNSWLIGYDMMRTDERTGPYPEGSVWASPRLEEAVETMRQIGANRSEIAVKAEHAHRDALEAASLERYAQRLDEQLRRVL
jgi:glycosyltransferase involved in cell wall biosynthesis